MACSSFTLSKHSLKHQNFSNTPPQVHNNNRISFRVSANYATTAERSFSTIQTSFYDVLGIQAGATCQEIKSAYRKLARVVHPDVASSNGRNDDASADEFMRVHAAYATLSDPDKRAVYDGTILGRGRRGGIVTAGGVNQRRRNWETDQCW